MHHRTYVAERIERGPRFADERSAAIAELAVGEMIVRRRVVRDASLQILSDTTGIPEARLDDIEAGESLSLHELLWLVHARELNIAIDPGFTISAAAPAGRHQAMEPTRPPSRPGRPTTAATA